MQQYDPDIKNEEEQENSSADEGPEPKPEFEFKFNVDTTIFANTRHIVLATNGPQSIWLKNNFTQVAGQINFSKATQSSLATIYKNEESVAIVFNKEIDDYHFTDYNFGYALFQYIPKENYKNLQFILITNNTSQSLLVTKNEEFYLRQFGTSTNKLKFTSVSDLETPNEFQGLFADILSEIQIRQCQAAGVILVHQDYEVRITLIEAFRVLEQQLPFLKLQTSKNALLDDLKKMNRERNKNILYL